MNNSYVGCDLPSLDDQILRVFLSLIFLFLYFKQDFICFNADCEAIDRRLQIVKLGGIGVEGVFLHDIALTNMYLQNMPKKYMSKK